MIEDNVTFDEINRICFCLFNERSISLHSIEAEQLNRVEDNIPWHINICRLVWIQTVRG